MRPPAWRIGAIAATVLILELAFIRQIPAEVRAISYFTNLILMAAFFGLGLGCILQKSRDLSWTLPAGVLLVFSFVLVFRGIVVYAGAETVHYWLLYAPEPGPALQSPLLLAAILAFLASAFPFIGLGQALARAMDLHPRLVAYGWDIAGSLVGTVVFASTAFLGVPPWVWPPVLLVLWAVWFAPSIPSKIFVALSGLPFLAFAQSPLPSAWSPYYFVQHRVEPGGIRVFVNSSPHQFGIDFTSPEQEQRALKEEMSAKWGGPYDFYREAHGGRSPAKVLVLGAGTGNDVHVALSNGAEEVVAVEIDPVILEIGRTKNRTNPYGDPRVRAIVDDARHFLRTSDERFDLIVFGTLDSQALLSGHANLRLENYVYTAESLAEAKELLNPDGMVVVYYSVLRPWLWGRIYATVREAFGDRMRMFFSDSQFLFNTMIVGSKGSAGPRAPPEQVAEYADARPSTDDWPFVYLERRTLSGLYLGILGTIGALIACVFVLLRRIHPVTGLHANFLFLGIGFTLMEASAIVRMALLFGSTWLVSTIVFAAVLATIFLANWSVLREAAPSLRISWAGLAVFIAVNFFFPLQILLGWSPAARVAAAAVLIGAPVYFASVCFSRLFAREPVTGYPLGVNLVGAMAGGLLEYASMVVGMRAVWLIALGVYFAAWAATSAAARGRRG